MNVRKSVRRTAGVHAVAARSRTRRSRRARRCRTSPSRGSARTGADWTEYEYQVRWSLRDGAHAQRAAAGGQAGCSASDAGGRADAAVREARRSRSTADRPLFAAKGIATAVVEIATTLGGKPRLQRKAILRAADAASTTTRLGVPRSRRADGGARDVALGRAARPKASSSCSSPSTLYLTPPDLTAPRQRRPQPVTRRLRPVGCVALPVPGAALARRRRGAGAADLVDRGMRAAGLWCFPLAARAEDRTSTCRHRRAWPRTMRAGRSSRSSATSPTAKPGAGGEASITAAGGGGILHFLVLIDTPPSGGRRGAEGAASRR